MFAVGRAIVPVVARTTNRSLASGRQAMPTRGAKLLPSEVEAARRFVPARRHDRNGIFPSAPCAAISLMLGSPLKETFDSRSNLSTQGEFKSRDPDVHRQARRTFQSSWTNPPRSILRR